MVEGTHEDTKGRVLCGPGMSGEFKEHVVAQGSAFTPLLFIGMVELISRKMCTKDIYSGDDLALLADEEANLQWEEA